MSLQPEPFEAVPCETARVAQAAFPRGNLYMRMLTVFQAKGWLKVRGRQRTDATHVLAAVRKLSWLVTVGETLRLGLNRLAQAEPDWLAPHLPPEWRDRYGHRLEESRLPIALRC